MKISSWNQNIMKERSNKFSVKREQRTQKMKESTWLCWTSTAKNKGPIPSPNPNYALPFLWFSLLILKGPFNLTHNKNVLFFLFFSLLYIYIYPLIVISIWIRCTACRWMSLIKIKKNRLNFFAINLLPLCVCVVMLGRKTIGVQLPFLVKGYDWIKL